MLCKCRAMFQCYVSCQNVVNDVNTSAVKCCENVLKCRKIVLNVVYLSVDVNNNVTSLQFCFCILPHSYYTCTIYALNNAIRRVP